MKERGSITFWVLGLSIAVLFLGGLSVDLWRVMSDRRELAAVADSAAAAAASAVDVDQWRQVGEIRLLNDEAVALAERVVAQHGVAGELSAPLDVAVAGDSVQVVLTREVELTLLRLLTVGEDPLLVRVVSVARAAPSP
ncbi:MAG: pilus assembly protein TadG-related protein [Acidimicrobiia bacterium]|nr:pilus assembly protein TadG-related protein [Acidimicrobiia bacterium]